MKIVPIKRIKKLRTRALDNQKYKSLWSRSFKIPSNNKKCAVVIHLYYLENWSGFVKKLKILEQYIDFDLYITDSANNPQLEEMVLQDYPGAIIITCPNRGRDVLPFIYIAKKIKDNYEYCLKLHSKKSTHWGGGKKWLDTTLDQLIPSDISAGRQLKTILDSMETGIVGPSDYYYPLTINFPANGEHISRLVAKLFGKNKQYEVTQKNRKLYGFFGGTMFWSRFDAIDKIIDHVDYRMFESENGQIDGTFAHALERLFCVIPEIDNKEIYEFNGRVVKKRPYRSDNIPEWSQDHDK